MNFKDKLEKIKQKNLYRQVLVHDKKLIDFCSNDYLGMRNHPKVIESFKIGADRFGVGSGGSHLINGHNAAHLELEEYLAEYTGQQKTLIFSTGYMANLGIFSTFKDDIDWVLQDRLNHASLIDANFLIGKNTQRYKHNDISSLQKKLDKQQGFGLIATDNVFSMDGDIAKINEINNIIDTNTTIFTQDDAHGFGVYPANIPKHSLYMATFGKGVGTFGAFVAGDSDVIEYIVQKSRPYTYTTATPAALSVATLSALQTIQEEQPQQQLFENIKIFKSLIQTDSNTAIQPIIMRDNIHALETSKYLENNGFLVKAIRTPTVAHPILRITLSTTHSASQIRKLAELLYGVL